MLTYGSTNSVRRSSKEDNLWPHSRTDLDLSDNQLAFALDDLFSPATIAKQFVINILGVSTGYRIFRTSWHFLTPKNADFECLKAIVILFSKPEGIYIFNFDLVV